MASSPTRKSVAATKATADDGFHTTPFLAAAFTALVSLLAIPVLYALDNTDSGVEHEVQLALIAVVVCATVLVLSQKVAFAGLPPNCKHDWYLGWFSLFAFTAIVDLLLAFNISKDMTVMQWYLENGERYLSSAYGYAINLWDGTAHWAMYIGMIYGLCHVHREWYRPLYLLWVGSIMFSLFSFLPGACIGAYSHEIKLSSFLNIPYAVIPLYFLARVLREAPPQYSSSYYSHSRIISFLFAALFIFSILFSFVRFCAAGGSKWPVALTWLQEWEPLLADPSRFFDMQAYVVFLYVVPFYTVATCMLLFGATNANTQRLIDWAALIAGGMMETQFALVVSAIHPLTDDQYRIPLPQLPVYLLLQVGVLTLGPVLFAIYLHYHRALPGICGGICCGRTVGAVVANGDKNE